MSTLAIAQKQNQAKQSESPHFSQPEISALEPGYVNAFGPNFRSTNGSGPGAGLLQKKTKGIEAVSGSTPMSRPAHDFSSIPVHAKAPVGLQAKLTINTPGDKYEQEADQVADRVMRMKDRSPIQEKYYEGKNEKKLQLKSIGYGSAGMDAPSIVKDVIKSGGQSLNGGARNFFEPRFGHDFSNVRIHTGSIAADSSRAINAHAYTLDNNIVFNSGKYAPNTASGRRLLAHELTHVIQQTGESASPMLSGFLQRQVKKPEKPDENKKAIIAMANRCPDIDETVMKWVYQKAEPFVTSYYSGINKQASITSRKTWKVPSQWGELDMDIFYKKLSREVSPEEAFNQLQEGTESHCKLITKLQLNDQGELRITGELIDWLDDGHPIPRRSWEGVINLTTVGDTCKAKIIDIAQPERPSAPSPTERDPKRGPRKIVV